MELGEKIKQARLEAGLSQRQLCGERLTRNMLSLIENGSARPSMDTLRYFATRLGKPLGWFLEEDAVTSPNQACMAAARQAWSQRKCQEVLAALEGYRAPDATFDEERGLLLYEARLFLAHRAIEENRMPYAHSLLEAAESCQSIYLTDDSRLQLLRARAGLPARLDCDDVLLARAEATLEADPQRCAVLLAAVQGKTIRWQLLFGLAAFARREYALAAEHLSAAEAEFPKQTIPKLEICYRELEDYKKAYEYACKMR